MSVRAVGVLPSVVALKSLAPGVKPKKASALLWPLWPKTLKASAVAVVCAKISRIVAVVEIMSSCRSSLWSRASAVLPERVLLVKVTVPRRCRHGDAAAALSAVVAGEGAVGHGQPCRRVVADAAAAMPAELPERVLLVTVSVPPAL